jgi:hypothetical protein
LSDSKTDVDHDVYLAAKKIKQEIL